MMMLVCFKLNDENPDFINELKSLGNWSNRIDGAWLVETTISPRQARDLLGAKMKDGERLFVARITENWAGRNMGAGFPEWIQRRSFDGKGPAKVN